MTDGDGGDDDGDEPESSNPGFDPPETPDRETEVVSDFGETGAADETAAEGDTDTATAPETDTDTDTDPDTDDGPETEAAEDYEYQTPDVPRADRAATDAAEADGAGAGVGPGTPAGAGAGAGAGAPAGEPSLPGGVGDGAPDDEDLPLAVHIEEMIKRLGVVLLVAGGVAAVAFPFGEETINFLWYSLLPDTAPPVVYKPLELLLTQMKVASLAGLVVALPVFVYETYQFMRPGLYPHERRYYLAAIPTSLLLAFVGLVFAYFVVLPAVFTYFLNYTEQTAQVAFGIGQTMDLILILMGYLAVVFQIPLFIMLALMMGLVTRQWLVGRRLLFWGAFAGISFIFSPDPTGMSPVIIALTMIALFEGTLLLARWTGRGRGRSAA